VGDRVLKLFSVAARAEMRGADIVGRIGGEEFAALLPDCDEHRAHEVAEHIRKAFAQTAATVDRNDLRATVSIGVASLKTGQGLGELLAAADRAVYRAKDAGRNRVRGAAEFGQTQERGRTNPPLAADPLAA
jgi:diguanylate cyclase (GGDEF)-like protein